MICASDVWFNMWKGLKMPLQTVLITNGNYLCYNYQKCNAGKTLLEIYLCGHIFLVLLAEIHYYLHQLFSIT